jgi:mono/diheme cytochrome c family protein
MSIGIERPAALALALATVCGSGCRRDMHDQPRYEPLEAAARAGSDSSARAPVAGTVAWGRDPQRRDPSFVRADELLFTGRCGAGPTDYAAVFPFEITAPLLDRGEERFVIFCSVCHDRAGTGNGMVVQRGFRRPPTLHSERLRAAPAGYLFDVISQGFGAMPSYASQIPVEDRWLIVAYLRALQLSQHARPEDVPPGRLPLGEG